MGDWLTNFGRIPDGVQMQGAASVRHGWCVGPVTMKNGQVVWRGCGTPSIYRPTPSTDKD